MPIKLLKKHSDKLFSILLTILFNKNSWNLRQAFYFTGKKLPSKGSIIEPLIFTKKMKFGNTYVIKYEMSMRIADTK